VSACPLNRFLCIVASEEFGVRADSIIRTVSRTLFFFDLNEIFKMGAQLIEYIINN
jgi:hypothetical protein